MNERGIISTDHPTRVRRNRPRPAPSIKAPTGGGYSKIEKVGEGTYGVVYKAKEVSTGNIVALKRIRVDAMGYEEGIPATALREISLFRELRNESIVRFRRFGFGTVAFRTHMLTSSIA
jgi:serine/threonine protein kinase